LCKIEKVKQSVCVCMREKKIERERQRETETATSCINYRAAGVPETARASAAGVCEQASVCERGRKRESIFVRVTERELVRVCERKREFVCEKETG
jgi:hypothetical protein